MQETDALELYPSEMQEVKILWADLQRKYGETMGTPEQMKRFKDEAESRFAQECGLVVMVDTANLTVSDSDQLILSPIINVVDRVNKHEFEFERAMRETQLGFYDGKPGTITNDGRLIDPTKNLNS